MLLCSDCAYRNTQFTLNCINAYLIRSVQLCLWEYVRWEGVCILPAYLVKFSQFEFFLLILLQGVDPPAMFIVNAFEGQARRVFCWVSIVQT